MHVVTPMARDEQVTKDAGAGLVFKTIDDALVAPAPAPDDANALAWEQWFDRQMERRWAGLLGDCVGELTGGLAKQIRKLELEVAELRGELRAIRGEHSKILRP